MASERIMELLTACDSAKSSVDQLAGMVAATNNATITALEHLLGSMGAGTDPELVTRVLSQAIVELRVASAQMMGGYAYSHWWAPYAAVYAAAGQGMAALLIMYAWSACTGWRRWSLWVVATLLAPYLGLCWFAVVAKEQHSKWRLRTEEWFRRCPLARCCLCCAQADDGEPGTPDADGAEAGEGGVNPAPDASPPAYEAVSGRWASIFSLGGASATAAQMSALTAAIVPQIAEAVGAAVGAAFAVTPGRSLYRWVCRRWSAPGGGGAGQPNSV